jgi:hypothetical protein
MIFIILAAIAALAYGKQKGTVTASVTNQPVSLTGVPQGVISTHVTHNSVGDSLSSALGNKNLPPSHYSSGNPGTNGLTLQPSSSIKYYRTMHRSIPFVPSVSNPTGGNKHVPYMGGKAGDVNQNDPPKPLRAVTTTASGMRKITYSPLVNPTQTGRAVINPETPGAFWTKRAVRIKAAKKSA